MATSPITITIPNEHLEELKRHAESMPRGPATAWRQPTYGSCIRQAVAEYLERRRLPPRKKAAKVRR